MTIHLLNLINSSYERIKKAEEKGIDVEDLIILAFEGIKTRLKLAKKYLFEAEDYLKKGDDIQGSEKVAEEVVKVLAEGFTRKSTGN